MYFQRVASRWNSLPWRLVEAGTLNIFKLSSDRFWIEKRIQGYGGSERKVELRPQLDQP